MAGLFGNQKAKKWTNGRKNWRNTLHKYLENSKSKIIWIHATSLGEFDQVKPLIEKIRNDEFFKNYKILVTFFSPSGYEYSKNYPLADYYFYLPADTIKNAADFIKITNPSIAVFVKYDFWFNYLEKVQEKHIPIIYFSCNFRKNQIYFKNSNKWQLDILKKTDRILTLNEASNSILEQHKFTNNSICGDTRFDKVVQNANRCQPVPLIEKFKQNKKLLILGSSWEKEEETLVYFLKKNPDWNLNLKIIIAPHNIYTQHVKEIENILPVKALKYSESNGENITQFDILIIDNIGMLSNLYQYGDIAFIGGGFTNRLHNILEAATFGNALLYGNNHTKFPEAQQLKDFGGGFDVNDKNEFSATLNKLLTNSELLNTTQTRAKEFITKNTGATDIVFEEVKKLII